MFIHSFIQQMLIEHLLKRALCQVILGIEGMKTSIPGRIFQPQVTELF